MPSGKTIAAGGISSLVAIALGVAVPNLKELEGRRNMPYYDIVKVLTVCDGHTGRDIVVRKVYSDKECDDLTVKDTQAHLDVILKKSPQLAYHPIQLASMISFDYNVGLYRDSPMAGYFNKGDYLAGCNYLDHYHKPAAIIGRRNKEKALCLSTLTPEGMKNVNLG